MIRTAGAAWTITCNIKQTSSGLPIMKCAAISYIGRWTIGHILFFLQLPIVKKVICPGRSVPKKWRPSKYKYNFQLWGNTIGSLNQEGGVREEWHWHSANRRNPRHVCWYKLICLVHLVLIYGITVGRQATDLQPGWKISMKTQLLLSPDMLSCLCKVSQHGSRLLIYHPRWPAFIR